MSDMRLIDANALLGFISDERKEAADNKNHEKMRGNDYEMHFWSGALVQARWIRQYVNEAPTIDAVPVVHGRWSDPFIGGYDGLHAVYYMTCSKCMREVRHSVFRYCPNCGAKMDAKEDIPCE